MKENTPAVVEEPVTDKRTRNKTVLAALGFLFGLLITFSGKFLTTYEGPWFMRLALMLAPWAALGILAFYSRSFYREDELELLINRKALAFAFYAALLSLVVVDQLQRAKLVPSFMWSSRVLVMLLGLLMCVGMVMSRRRYH